MSKTPQSRILNYQEILRDIAHNMVRLKQPERLLKMVTRYISRELGLTHTSVLTLHEKKNYYRFLDSRGARKLPVSLLRMDADNILVRWFGHSKRRDGFAANYLLRKDIEEALSRGEKSLSGTLRRELEALNDTLKRFNVELVIPGHFKRELLVLFLFGRKKNGQTFHQEEISFFQIVTQDCSMAVKTAEYHRCLSVRNQELARHLKEIEQMREKEQQTYYEIMRSLAQEVYAKDPYTFGHLGEVERLGMMTAREMKLDMRGRRKDILSAGLILHDVGKIGIPDHILNKPGRHTEDERKVMQEHAQKGAAILAPLSDFKEVAEIVHCHHERFDGSGYPRGIKGDEIPIEARIVSVVDAFHAIVSTRCYSVGRPISYAFQELRRCGGTQFDPLVVEAFVKAMTRDLEARNIPIDDLESPPTEAEPQAVAS